MAIFVYIVHTHNIEQKILFYICLSLKHTTSHQYEMIFYIWGEW